MIAAVVLTFAIAGGVKGVIGLGLPTISLALLTAVVGLPKAMALLLVPSFVTNLWQAAVGGNGRAILARMWPFLLTATVTVWVGALALTRVDVALLSALLGVLLVIYSALNLAGVQLVISRQREPWLGPVAGTMNGVLTGMTGSFVVPGILYLHAIGLPRDMLIQAMGVLFTASTAALALALGGNSLLNAELGALSATGIIPAVIGMIIGRRVRTRLPDRLFRRVFFASLLVLGAYIAVRSLV
jgi:uncharacterized membrane protein YfcA